VLFQKKKPDSYPGLVSGLLQGTASALPENGHYRNGIVAGKQGSSEDRRTDFSSRCGMFLTGNTIPFFPEKSF
jgi:hypothetical protein